MTAPGEDFLATPPAVLAADSLRTIREMAASPGTSVEDIREMAELALARLDFLGRSRDRNRKRFQWLAKVSSFAFPRTFSTETLPKASKADELVRAARQHHHVCFTVQVTQGGGKDARGRELEVQVPADKALQLGQQIIRIAESFGPTRLPAATRRGTPVPPHERRRMT